MPHSIDVFFMSLPLLFWVGIDVLGFALFVWGAFGRFQEAATLSKRRRHAKSAKKSADPDMGEALVGGILWELFAGSIHIVILIALVIFAYYLTKVVFFALLVLFILFVAFLIWFFRFKDQRPKGGGHGDHGGHH
jgi:hypothetical protein